jgi:transcription elongation factor Elf1
VKIKKIISQHRRDFYADYECEHCGHIEPHQAGYDDDYFHRNVIPTMKCKKCGKTASEDYRPLTTKYPEGYQV